MTYDVIVIGGGPSGLMACIAASGHAGGGSGNGMESGMGGGMGSGADLGGGQVLLIDKGDKLGRKLGISGGGRCNVTNAKERDELIKNIPGNGRFLHSALSTFGNRDIMAFFEGMGIRLKEEDRGRMFPVSDKAKTVVDALVNRVRSQGVEIRSNSPVRRVLYEHGRVAGVELAGGERLASRAVVLATGGKSVPHTGSTGDGYPWAEAAGHTITELYPTEVPITSQEAFIQSRELQGLSLRNITLSVWSPKNKRLIEHEGDLIFTHFGLSGPAALRCSQFVVKALKQFEEPTIRMTIDLLPDRTEQEIYEDTLRLAQQEPKKQIKNVLRAYVPERLLPLLFKKAGLPEDITYGNIPKQPWQELSKLIKAFPVRASGTLSIEEAFVTGGGVHLKEIDPRTMQSKLTEGLFFCGEILDIHGYTGGYNITAAFTTGYTAGKSAAEYAAEDT